LKLLVKLHLAHVALLLLLGRRRRWLVAIVWRLLGIWLLLLLVV
jgi:hypothetical protein